MRNTRNEILETYRVLCTIEQATDELLDDDHPIMEAMWDIERRHPKLQEQLTKLFIDATS